jgi:hypothetical protein
VWFAGILRDHTPDACMLVAGDEMVPSAWRHAGNGITRSAVPSDCLDESSRIKTRSEIPCRVSSLPELEVTPTDNRLITGKPSSYAMPQGRRSSEWVIPWEVASREVDPVTTDRPSGREIAFPAAGAANPRA